MISSQLPPAGGTELSSPSQCFPVPSRTCAGTEDGRSVTHGADPDGCGWEHGSITLCSSSCPESLPAGRCCSLWPVGMETKGLPSAPGQLHGFSLAECGNAACPLLLRACSPLLLQLRTHKSGVSKAWVLPGGNAVTLLFVLCTPGLRTSPLGSLLPRGARGRAQIFQHPASGPLLQLLSGLFFWVEAKLCFCVRSYLLVHKAGEGPAAPSHPDLHPPPCRKPRDPPAAARGLAGRRSLKQPLATRQTFMAASA